MTAKELIDELVKTVAELKGNVDTNDKLIETLQTEQAEQWEDIGRIRQLANDNAGSIKAIEALCKERGHTKSNKSFFAWVFGGLAIFLATVYKIYEIIKKL